MRLLISDKKTNLAETTRRSRPSGWRVNRFHNPMHHMRWIHVSITTTHRHAQSQSCTKCGKAARLPTLSSQCFGTPAALPLV